MPSDPRLRGVPPSPRETLFNAIVGVLRNDPVVRAVFDPILAWDGNPKDREPLALDMGNALRLTPVPGPSDWWAPSEQKCWLLIDVEMLVRGTAWADADRAWHAVELAFYTGHTAAEREVVWDKLRASGAWTGLPQFSAPPVDPDPAAGGAWRCSGQFRIECRLPFNS